MMQMMKQNEVPTVGVVFLRLGIVANVIAIHAGLYVSILRYVSNL